MVLSSINIPSSIYKYWLNSLLGLCNCGRTDRDNTIFLYRLIFIIRNSKVFNFVIMCRYVLSSIHCTVKPHGQTSTQIIKYFLCYSTYNGVYNNKLNSNFKIYIINWKHTFSKFCHIKKVYLVEFHWSVLDGTGFYPD